jgi:hypothetical protein
MTKKLCFSINETNLKDDGFVAQKAINVSPTLSRVFVRNLQLFLMK